MSASTDGLLAALPSTLIEATNGSVMAVLLFVIGGFVAYIVEHWLHVRYRYEPPWALRPIIIVYHQRKAAIALLWGLAGFEVRTFSVWWPRHLVNDGLDPLDYMPVWLAPTLLVGGTIMAVVGLTCWLRVTLPLRIVRWAPVIGGRTFPVGQGAWFIIAALCVAWGSWMAWR